MRKGERTEEKEKNFEERLPKSYRRGGENHTLTELMA